MHEQPENPIVWVVQNTLRKVNNELVPVHDTSKAEEYGERKIALGEALKPWNPGQAMPDIQKFMDEYSPSEDYLLLIGSPIYGAMLFAAAVAVASEGGNTHVGILYWSARHGKYDPIEIDIRGLEP